MPELPEVEYARVSLEHWLRGATIESIEVGDGRILDGSAARLQRSLVGERVRAVDRRGKWLRVALEHGALFSHLGMTGKWVRVKPTETRRFERLRIDARLRGASRSVRYLDPRLFGRLVFADDGELPEWGALGPDPLHDGLDRDALFEALQRRSAPIKPTLMDQALIAGLGNIQVTEALFFARIDPRRPSRSLSKKEVNALVRGTDKTLRKTLADQVGPEIMYVEEPGAENPFSIYGRGGEPCPRCGEKLHKIVLGGRGTVFCTSCQR